MKIVYIDVQNVHRKTLDYGRKIDRHKFFIYLKAKYSADIIYYAVWYIEVYKSYYEYLKKIWYVMLYKETILLPTGEIKGNVDIDIAITCIYDLWKNNLQVAYLVTNDGDYNSLIKKLIEEKVFGGLIVPDRKTASRLIKKFNRTILDIQEIRAKVKKE